MSTLSSFRSVLRNGASTLRNFKHAAQGNVTITFALAMIPLIGFMGAAVDYSHANSVRSSLQAAVDATALMLSKDAAKLTTDQLATKAFDSVKALFNRPEAVDLKVTPTYSTTGGSQILLNATARVPTNFLSLFNKVSSGIDYSYLPIGSSTTVKWGNARLRVALVLDNTGSMKNAGKMDALKTAAKNLLTQLKSAATKDGDVYVSIIPFAKDVNAKALGTSSTYDQWVKWSGQSDTWDENNGTCSKKPSSYKTKSKCTSNSGTWTPSSHSDWNGCVTDRDQDYDTTNTSPSTATSATLFPAEQYSSCPTAMMGLSYDWTALANKVDAMKPDGNTNQGIGLQWGFQSLMSAPFVIPAKDTNYTYSDAIILLSDGENTENRWSTSASKIDARQAITCQNAKNAKVTIYAVQVNTDTPADPTSTVLKNCASTSDKFFVLTTANQLIATFDQIGTALSQLRIAN